MIVDKRKRLIFFLLAMLVLIVLLVWMLISLFSSDESDVATTEPTTNTTVVQEVEPVSVIDEQRKQTREQSAGISALAKTFAERYGSYSNESRFSNLRDLLPLMTSSFAKSTQAVIDSSETPATYYGVTSRVVTVEVLSLDEEVGTASFELTLQREEAVGSPRDISVSYQKLHLDFEQEDRIWKVASASWL
jgi:hypothetical protein